MAIVAACDDVLLAELVAKEARLLCLCTPNPGDSINTTGDIRECNVDRNINPYEYFANDNTVLIHSTEGRFDTYLDICIVRYRGNVG